MLGHAHVRRDKEFATTSFSCLFITIRERKKPTLDNLLYMKAQEELALTAKVILAMRSRLIF